MNAPILRVEALSKRFRGLLAISDVSFAVEPGSITSVIGPNGAGKSTLFNLVTGYLAPLGPMTLVIEPGSTANETSEIASRPRKRLLSASTRRIGARGNGARHLEMA